MSINIGSIIYIYLAVSFMLMSFNFAYSFKKKIQNRNKAKNNKKWYDEVIRQMTLMTEGKGIEPRHMRILSRRLTRIDALISYIQAIELIKNELPEQLMEYICENYPLIQELAFKYGRKDSMERAFFADFICRFPPYHGIEYRPLLDILISYIDNSTVYCRENVLRALYSLGNARGVENALQIINDRGLFHHQRLVSDGLMTFTGDKQALAKALWNKYKQWGDGLMIAVVQFITLCSPDFKEPFFDVLIDSNVDIEIRLAVMRYFRKYHYEPVQAVLMEYLTAGNQADENLAVVAASVLSQYSGNDTVDALIDALGSPNWYVRYNAASSIAALGISEDDLEEVLEEVLESDDRYAKEILLYKLEQEGYEYREMRKAVYA